MANNFASRRWSEKEMSILTSTLKQYDWEIRDLPMEALKQKLNRSTDAILSRARLILARTYPWEQAEEDYAFRLYLKGLSLKEILDKLHSRDSEATMQHLEDKIKDRRLEVEEDMRNFAEERSLKVPKHFSLDTIIFFLKNKDTQSPFVKSSLLKRISRG